MILENLINIPRPYISKELESNTLKHVQQGSAFVAYEMFLLTNGVKRRYDFMEYDNQYLDLSAYVTVDYALTGKAKSQIIKTDLAEFLLKKKPRYTVFCELSVKGQYNNYIYKFRFKTTRINSVYRVIEETKQEIKQILESYE
jgi:hypothetical protein